MNYQINVANIKSDGCANTIRSTLGEIDGVSDTVVNISNGIVIVDATEGIHDRLALALFKLGYPETMKSRINNSLTTKAKSLISCVKGRFG